MFHLNLLAIYVLFFCIFLPAPVFGAFNDSRFTDWVSWDGYSFALKISKRAAPQRIFLHSGDVHPFRLPVPDLWPDIFQKMKAAGLNAVTFYTHWALMNPKRGVLDFTGFNDIQRFIDAAGDAGLWVLPRPGPYINSETTGGAIPGWVTTLPGDPEWNPYNGELRSNDTTFRNAWKPYIKAMAQLLAKNQITRGGPVIMVQIDNEYYNGPGQNQYIDELVQAYREEGLVVPTSVNDPGLFQNLVHDADIYSFDQYPQGLQSSPNGAWRDFTSSLVWRDYHERVFPGSPLFIPEFQGGMLNGWGSPNKNFDVCRELTNERFVRVYLQALLAQGSSGVNWYMFYGGTNWGQISHPSTYTSYDFGAAMTESRELTTKYNELKLHSFFLRAVPDIYKTDMIANSTEMTTNPRVHTTLIRNPDTGASFYITRQANISAADAEGYQLTIRTLKVPQLGGQLVLDGHDSHLVVTNWRFGRSQLIYATAHILTAMTVDGVDTLFLYGDAGSTVEFAIGTKSEMRVTSDLNVQTKQAQDHIIVNTKIPATGMSKIALEGGSGSGVNIFVIEYATAATFWQPTVSGAGKFGKFPDIAATTPVLVVGPYLVRGADIHGNTLALMGDLNSTTSLQVFAPKKITHVTWNTRTLRTSTSPSGALTATISGPKQDVLKSLPALRAAEWRYADSLPEIQPGFADSKWTSADKENTTSKFPRYYGGPWNLSVASDYGYHAGNLLWRGHFTGAGQQAVNLSISGGPNFVASGWLNDAFLGVTDSRSPTDNVTWAFPSGALLPGKDNVITILQDHMGFYLAGAVVCCTPGGRQRDIQSPRGIEGYFLLGENNDANVAQFTGFKVQGNFRGEDFPDHTRKSLNEGGLFGERMGFHLPGFDDSKWERRAPWVGAKKQGVAWFRTTFKLDIPSDVDIPFSFVFADAPGLFRAQLYVNGWQMGKRVGNLGPQTAFPVHPGILDLNGVNTVAISVWSFGDAPEDLAIPSLELVPSVIYAGGPGRIAVNNPGWKDLRA